MILLVSISLILLCLYETAAQVALTRRVNAPGMKSHHYWAMREDRKGDLP